MDGEVIHMRLWDIGAEVDLARVERILGRKAEAAPLLARSPTPAYATFSRPLEIRLPAAERGLPGTIEARVHTVGVVALRLRVPFEGVPLEDLQAGRAPALDPAAVAAAFDALREAVGADLAPHLREAYSAAVDPETYRVYCLTGGADPARLLAEERDLLGRLVAGERGPSLVPERLDSALRHVLRYTAADAVVLGWDDAVVVGKAGAYEDILDVMEIANLQLLEFRTYDALLDRRLEDSFAALDRLWARGGLFRSARSALQDISKLRVDLARLTDNLHDTGKVFGDWYLAQVHRRLGERFHVASWEKAVREKMQTLEDMFHLAEEEANHRRSLLLEVLVIALFLVDLLLVAWAQR